MNPIIISRLPDKSGLSNDAQQAIDSRIRQIQTSEQQVETVAPKTTVQAGTHLVRLGTPAAKQQAGSVFIETDRGYHYVAQGNVWKFVSGLMTGALAARPSDLVASDAGSQFGAISGANYTLYIWSGSTWLTHA